MSISCRPYVMALAMLAPLPGNAVTLSFAWPAVQTFAHSEALSSYSLPTGPWADGNLPVREVEGPRAQVAWRIAAPRVTTLQILAPLRDQLKAQGYTILWECQTDACGGFDFRFSTEVLPEPEMHIDMGDFRFLAAEKAGSAKPQVVSLLVSRSAENGFVQLTSVGGDAAAVSESAPAAATQPGQPQPDPPAPTAPPQVPAGLSNALLAEGHVALDDLTFDTGSANLGGGDFASLDDLAAFLKANPEKTVALVGHTDASGGLVGNTTLSKARADSVRERLVKTLGVTPEQVTAEGVGYLAPRATNQTEEGRAQNRRVEAILTSTQ